MHTKHLHSSRWCIWSIWLSRHQPVNIRLLYYCWASWSQSNCYWLWEEDTGGGDDDTVKNSDSVEEDVQCKGYCGFWGLDHSLDSVLNFWILNVNNPIKTLFNTFWTLFRGSLRDLLKIRKGYVVYYFICGSFTCSNCKMKFCLLFNHTVETHSALGSEWGWGILLIRCCLWEQFMNYW